MDISNLFLLSASYGQSRNLIVYNNFAGGNVMKRIIKRGILLLCFVSLLCLSLIHLGLFDSNSPKTASLDLGWNLILVNKHHTIPEDYPLELTELSNGEKVDTRIYPALHEMFDDARKQSVYMTVVAGHRTNDMQQDLLDQKIEEYKDMGYVSFLAKKKAKEWVAVPGTSEHQLGIAMDINPDPNIPSSRDVYGWLEEHSYEYGFIHRYPSDKTSITGIINEPWHYRYVGKEAAYEMYINDLCLEEYIELQK